MNRFAFRRGSGTSTRCPEELVVRTVGARAPSTVDRSGIITCLLKFLLNRANLRGAKLIRMSGIWDHISLARPPPNGQDRPLRGFSLRPHYGLSTSRAASSSEVPHQTQTASPHS